jgi:polyisoprenoid-binding protein YceI
MARTPTLAAFAAFSTLALFLLTLVTISAAGAMAGSPQPGRGPGGDLTADGGSGIVRPLSNTPEVVEAASGPRAQSRPEADAPETAGAGWRLTLDPEATRITFTLGATLHTVEGTARLAEGMLIFDPESGNVSGEVVVDATSADTGNNGRDEDMHAKVLNSDRFPDIVLRPRRLEGDFDPAGSSQVRLTGEMEIHGSRHPVRLPAELTVEGRRLSAHLTFTIPYVEWGMTDPSKFILRVDKEVEVEVEAVGELESPAESATP